MCTWCEDPNAEDADGELCLTHRAEFLGLSVAEMQRGEGIRHGEWLDTQY